MRGVSLWQVNISIKGPKLRIIDVIVEMNGQIDIFAIKIGSLYISTEVSSTEL